MKYILYIIFLFSLSSTYAQVSQKYFGRTGANQIATEFATLNNGNKVIVGHNTATGSNAANAVIMCIDANDNIQWTKEVSTTYDDRFISVTATIDGGCVAVGTIYTPSGSNGIIYKFSSAGSVVWSKVISTSYAAESMLHVIEVPGSGNIVCCGLTGGGNGAAGVIIDLNSAGTTLWAKAYDKSANDGIRGCTYLNGKIIASGFYTGSTFYDGYLLAVNEQNGNVVWNRAFDYSSTFFSGFSTVWPRYVYTNGSKIYLDAYITSGFGFGGTTPSVVSFDTTGLNPFCLEYPISGFTWSCQFFTHVVSPTEIYLVQNSTNGSQGWDGFESSISNTQTLMKDFVCTKTTSLVANTSNIIYSRKLSTTGEQGIQQGHMANGKFVGVGAAINDPLALNGPIDLFKVEFDPSFPATSTNCVASATNQQLSNPAIIFNANFTFDNIFTPSLTTSSTIIAVNTVSNNISTPCGAQDTVINKYAAVLSRNSCDNSFLVDTATDFNVGDTILVIQMKGAVVDSSNSATFGSVLDYKSAGNYEYNVVLAKTGNNLTLKYKLTRTYEIPAGRVQFVKVPHAINYTINTQHSCMPWTGTKGGVFALNVDNTLTLNNNIDVSGKGFKGGQPLNMSQWTCGLTGYYYPSTNNEGGQKGEGIAEVSILKNYGRGNASNGGGGGNSSNTGGGGGGNIGVGGIGGLEWQGCNSLILNSGRGGSGLSGYSVNKIYLGGGGGAGHGNNNGEGVAGNGGGIVIIRSNIVVGNSAGIKANGGNGQIPTNFIVGINDDGTGGGGGGGTILLQVNTFNNPTTISASGGVGASFSSTQGNEGPGGGGGGGLVALTPTITPSNVSISTAGGANGLINGIAYGAQPGLSGQSINNFQLLFPVNIFQPNAISVNFNDSVISCFSRSFKNLSSTISSGINSVLWDFGGGITSTLTSPTHTFSGYGSFPVKLTVTDSNGCKDSITKSVIIKYRHFANAGKDTSACQGLSVILKASGGIIYLWSPAAQVTSPNTATTIASPSAYPASFIVTVTDSINCVDIDTVVVKLKPGSPIKALPIDTMVCKDGKIQLSASGGLKYSWSNGSLLTDSLIANPIATIPAQTTFVVTGTDEGGCANKDSVTVYLRSNPNIVITTPDAGISCNKKSIQLYATGALSYIWHPGIYCNDSLIPSPTVNPTKTTTFTVTGTDLYGCKDTSSIQIIAYYESSVYLPNAFTPDGDGLNDVIRPLSYCGFKLKEFRVYNRWGECVFLSNSLAYGWDGNYKGQRADMGVYSYLIQGTEEDGTPVLKKGNVTLLR